MKEIFKQLDRTDTGEFVIKNTVAAQDYAEYMGRWQNRLPKGWCSIYSIGENGGYPILVAEFTNPEIPREEKEVAMVIAQHSFELSGTNTVFSVGNYLANGDDLAKEIMSKQVVVVVPAFNMFAIAKMDKKYQFKNHAGIDEYQPFGEGWEIDKEKAPAGYALKTLIDKLKPELILDFHGVWFVGGGCFESSGGFSHANLNYCYDTSFIKAINKAAEEKGYAVFDEDSMQSLRPVDPICYEENNRVYFRKGRPSKLMALYSYLKYHTMFINFEVCYEESGFYRAIEALRLGCHPIIPMKDAGYPVRVMRSFMFSGSMLVGGKNADERRKSRAELWENLSKLPYAVIAAEIKGLQSLFVVTNQKKMRESYGEGGGQYLVGMQKAYEVLEKMGCKTERLKQLYKPYEDAIGLYFFDTEKEQETAHIKNGMTLRIAIANKDAVPTEVLINGEPVGQDRYDIIRHGAFTYIDAKWEGEVPDMFGLVVKYDYEPREVGIMEFTK